MGQTNYQCKSWRYIYDQMMEKDKRRLLDEYFAYHQTNLRDVNDRVLCCACGTGPSPLPPLAQGNDLRI